MSLEHHSWNETTDSEDETASFSLTTNGRLPKDEDG